MFSHPFLSTALLDQILVRHLSSPQMPELELVSKTEHKTEEKGEHAPCQHILSIF